MKTKEDILERLNGYTFAQEQYLKENKYAGYRRMAYKINELRWVLGLKPCNEEIEKRKAKTKRGRK